MSEMADAASNDPGFGVYVHWPFCAQKCPYCDFNSHVRFKGWDEDRFLAAYMRELSSTRDKIGPRRVRSIFFGGGTPSLMKPATVAAILDHIAKIWTVESGAEITLEANPGSVEAERFRGYRDAGINRVSMGLQSLRDDDLKKLGRIHTVAESKAALKIARETFERFSFDLIYARPGQQPDDWRTELIEALELARDHLSLYQLTIEPDTPYAALHAAGKLIVPDPDAALALYEITQELTADKGLAAYEISNHAEPGAESQHNLLYWRYGEYAGIGPGAHGRLLVDQQRLATVTQKHPESWAALVEDNATGLTEETAITQSQEADEMLLMGLRLREGVALDRLARVGGVALGQKTVAGLTALGLIEIIGATEDHSPHDWRANELNEITACHGPDQSLSSRASLRANRDPGFGVHGPVARIRATPKGRFVLNAVVAELSASFETAQSLPATDCDGQRPTSALSSTP